MPKKGKEATGEALDGSQPHVGTAAGTMPQEAWTTAEQAPSRLVPARALQLGTVDHVRQVISKGRRGARGSLPEVSHLRACLA